MESNHFRKISALHNRKIKAVHNFCELLLFVYHIKFFNIIDYVMYRDLQYDSNILVWDYLLKFCYNAFVTTGRRI